MEAVCYDLACWHWSPVRAAPQLANNLCILSTAACGTDCGLGLQVLAQQDQLLEQHSMDPVCHNLARRQAGTRKAAVADALAAGRIPLVLTDVEGAKQAKASGQDCLTLFLAPASPEASPALHAAVSCLQSSLTVICQDPCRIVT